MDKNKLLTLHEAREWHKKNFPKGDARMVDRQNTWWEVLISRKCRHKWQPVQISLDTGNYMPSLEGAHVFCVCLKCRSWTYMICGWTNYFLGDPDELEQKAKEEFLNQK